MARPLVMFGEDWGGLPSSTQHLARRFAEDRPVIWVNSIGLRRPRLTLKDAGRVLNKLRRMIAPRVAPVHAVPVPAGMTVVHPRAVSWPGSALAAVMNRVLLGRQIRKALADRGLERPILWTSLPSAVDVAGALGAAGLVYYCCDDFEGLEGVDHGPVGRMERRLVARADLVFTTSDHLARKLSAGNHVSLPHGADTDHFMTPAPRPADLPTGKTALFYGSLSGWIDTGLLAELARTRPDWNLVLIGAVQTDVSELQTLDNVHLLGPRAHAELPGYVQHADAALLPFRDTPQIRACNPLKLREYLASGTPVVSTDFPALAPYRAAIQVAEGADGFSTALDSLDPKAAGRRQSLVRGETWEARADQALAAIDRIAA